MVDVDNKIEQSTDFMKEDRYNRRSLSQQLVFHPTTLGAIPTTVILNKRGEMVVLWKGRDYSALEMIQGIKEVAGGD
ncbi:hypothetical protein JHJ32_07860 [Parapedobacter sp. ISTM3]|uniref:hypothetical protein n=1 Tax=Parapedobacter sp. ISTM3 TaxID=2800130 RepID=UPI0019039A2A|nr:hypothetical protein [Parapedobacter sp. ISTM3]MBK1439894.1 hypothetical protein [Parapedobacter sp. ISTM3]